MLTRRKRPTNAELLELAQIQDQLYALREALDAARCERRVAERRAHKVETREFEDWRRAMRESGRAHEIHKGKPVEPRSAERVEAEGAVAQAQAREEEARQRSQERGDETWEHINTFRHLTGQDQRRLIQLRGWPTDRYMKAVREDPKNPSRPRWSDDDVAAWKAARARGGPRRNVDQATGRETGHDKSGTHPPRQRGGPGRTRQGTDSTRANAKTKKHGGIA